MAPTALDLALVLAIDTSGSVSDQRLALQIDGYAAAFREPELVRVIRSGRRGRIIATFVEWSDVGRQTQAVEWTMITDGETAQGFADAILKAFLPTPGWTSISGAIDFSTRLLSRLYLPADRRVIDISGDGTNNDGRPVETARDDAVAAGITINGLPILGVEPELDRYYRRHVIGGPQSFLVVARDEASFATAVMDKLLQEVAGTAPPRYDRGRV
ncbi:MAG TPA: DUF1194 domain-containing protein [Acetobacteraceae bacterium]